MRRYVVTYHRYSYGKRVKRHTRTERFSAMPRDAYAIALDLARPGETISTFWYEVR